jgi:leucine dehydrogenase
MLEDFKEQISPEKLKAYAKEFGLAELHACFDEESGLQAIIGIHSIKLGPALGGTRQREYPSFLAAVKDLSRLCAGMSRKAAMANLPLGGGKAILIKPSRPIDRQKYFTAYGQFVHTLAGRYVTAVDSGTEAADMDIVLTQTPHVTSISSDQEWDNPSFFTANGVRRSIEAAVKFRLNRDDLKGLKIAIQGVGKVGYYLAKELHERGAELIVADVNTSSLEKCRQEFGANIVDVHQIHQSDCDVFSPCAFGAGLHDKTIPEIKAKIIVGAANNQLAEPRDGVLLLERGILYAPDYVTNAGGVIHAASQYLKTPADKVKEKVDAIYDTQMLIFKLAEEQTLPTNIVADKIAEERIK